MRTLINDVRFGIRQLRRSPGFTIIAVFTIALGIGATTAMFSVVNAVLLRPLPFPRPERLVNIGEYDTRHGLPRNQLGSLSYPDLEDIRNRNHSFSDVALYFWYEATLSGVGEPLHVNISQVSASLFPILGVQPTLGRIFRPEEDQPGHYVAIVSDHFWRTRLNSSSKAIGQNIDLNGRAFSIVGVMPPGFQFPFSAEPRDLWLTTSRSHETDEPGDTPFSAQRGAHAFGAVGRLQDGVSLAQANADLKSIAAALSQQYPDTNSHMGMASIFELDSLVGDLRTPLTVLLAAVGLVLLIACANVANLLLVRGSERIREMGVRAALGASRLRVLRQLLTESLILSLAGAGLGVIFASFMLSGVLRLYPKNLPRADVISLDGRVLLFSAGLAIVTGILFGLAPALRTASSDLASSVRSGAGRTATAGRGHNRLRSTLVVAETAIGVMLLIGAGLLLRSLHRLTHVDLGFDPEHLLTASFDLSETKYNADQQDRFVNNLLLRLNSLPGVVSASGGLPLPMGEDHYVVSFNQLDHPLPPSSHPTAAFYVVTTGFFESMRMPLIRGRFFDERDTRNSAPTMIISQAFAKKYFSNEDPIGKRIEIGASEGASRDKYKIREIIGVVGDLRTSDLDKLPVASYYAPLSQLMWGAPTLVIRTAGQPYGVVDEIAKTVRSMDSAAPLYNVRSMEEYLALALGRARFQTLLLGLFAGIALLLTAIGLYGVMAQSVSQRTQEIGIRLAMGATRESVRSMILRRGTILSLAGTAVGVIGAIAFARVMESLLYEIPPRDPMTYVAVCVLLALVALLASYIPAFRATRLDPMVALRYE